MDSPTIVVARLDDKELQESIQSMVTSFNQGLNDMKTHADSVVRSINESLKGIKGGSVSSGGTSDGGSTKRAKAQSTEAKAIDASTDSYSRQEAVISQLMRTSERYTEEIKKQAQAIRESKEWQEKGRYTFADGTTILNLENEKKGRVDLEQQILDYQHKQAQAALVAAASEEKVEQAALRVAMAMHNVNAEAAESNKILRGKGGSNESLFQRYGDLRSSVAAVLNVEQSRVNIADIETASTKKLSASLKQLQEAYDNLSAADRNSHQGKELVFNIQQIQREIQKIKAQASRPISLDDVLNLPTNTLDEITYKMRQLQVYKGGLNLETQRKEMSEVNKAYDSLKRAQLSYMSDAQKMTGINEALGRSWNYMKNRLAFYFTVGASTQLVKELIRVRSEYEMNERALGILVGSAERGTQIFRELSQMSLVSPYTLIELSSAAKQLTAYDVAAKDVVDTTRRLADMASAVGVPIERLTYALGQIKAYGYLNSRDARMFANAGIPLVKQLADYYTELEGKLVSTADVYDRIKKKAVDYNEVMAVINKMTDEGGKFFDFQSKMADTLKVRLANLTLAWNNMLNDVGAETQGFLTWGIGALRDLFLHWKEFDALIKNAAWALGIRTALMFVTWGALKVGVALGATRTQMALTEVFGKRLATTLKTVGYSFLSLVKNPLTWWSLLAVAAVEATQAISGANEAQKALNESIRKGAKDNYDNIAKFLEQYKGVKDSLYQLRKDGNIDMLGTPVANIVLSPVDIDKNEAQKAWEAIREQIELTVTSSDKYIGRLLAIENISERARQGFKLLDDVQVVNAALKEMNDNTIKVSKDYSAWWNLWQLPDGLIENLEEATEWENKLIKVRGSLGEAVKIENDNWVRQYNKELEELRENIAKTTDSIIAFIELKGWSGDAGKINAVFDQITQKLITDNNLDPQKAFNLQLELEEARSKAAKAALEQRIKDESAALKLERDKNRRALLQESIRANLEEFNNWDSYNGRKRVEWERFTKWLKTQHISEVTAMFRGMDAEEIKSINFQEGKYGAFVKRMTEAYAKEHKLSIDETNEYLKNFVRDANQMSIIIPLMLMPAEGKSIYEQLGEYDKIINDAEAKINRLNTRIKELTEKQQLTKEETKELADAQQELANAEKDKADAEAKGGHGKEKKSGKGGSKKDPVLDALKTEIKLVEQLQGEYDKLTKSGANREEALGTIRGAFGNTIKQLNSQLRGYGLPELTTQLITGKDPNKALAHFKQTLQSLVDKGMTSLERSKEVEAIIEKLTISAKTYNLDKITKGLNSELDKLKEEYELAVELDANPELGGLFADWWDVDMEGLPHTAQAYAERATKLVNQYLADNNAGLQLPLLTKITNDDLRSLREAVDADQFNAKWLEIIENAVKASRDVRQKEASDQITDWDNLLQKYSEYEYKKGQIAKTAEKERQTIVERFGTDEQKERFAKIKTELDTEQDPEKKDVLKSQLIELVDSIASSNDTALQIKTSIDTKEMRDLANLDFTEFQKTGTWAVATGDLAGMTNTALRGLIRSLEEYKAKAKNLDPKQIKQINRALKSLHSELRKNNPFGAIADAMEEARMRSNELDVDIQQTQAQIDKLIEKREKNNGLTEEEDAQLQKYEKHLNDLNKTQDALADVSLQTMVTEVTKVTSALSGATSMVGELAEAFGDTATSEVVKDVGTVLDKIGQGASIGSVGGGWGALAGAIVGLGAGLAQIFAGSGNKKITEAVEDSEDAVKRLEAQYKSLEYAVEKSYGVAQIGALKASKANKELQLAELKRQLLLEESREAKHRDEEKIESLKGQIIDLEHEINDMVEDFVNDIMGISSVGDAMENVVSSMIEAFKKGEDYMKEYDDSFAEMIDNMIAKSIASQLVSETIEKVAKKVKDAAYTRTNRKENERRQQELLELIPKYQSELDDWEGDVAQRFEEYQDRLDEYNQHRGRMTWEEVQHAYDHYIAGQNDVDRRKAEIAALQKELDSLNKLLSKEVVMTPEDVDAVRNVAADARSQVQENFKALMDAYGITFGQDAEGAKLSSLQAGIQGVTEETAGAIEAYMNGVSQQCYLHSSLLTQIRDVIIGFDPEVSLGVQSQMLLQLQSQYQLTQSIHAMMESWTNPAGNGIRVELLS